MIYENPKLKGIDYGNILIMSKSKIWIPIFLISSMFFCFASELIAPHNFENEPIEIIGGHFLASEAGYGYIVTLEPHYDDSDNISYSVIATNIIRIGWDEHFILAESLSDLGNSIEYHIFNVVTRQHYGCTEANLMLKDHIKSEGGDVKGLCGSKDEYKGLLENLNVSSAITLQDVEIVYFKLKN